MRSNYQLVFTVRVYHSYFEQSICDCLYFDPGANTRSLIKRYGVTKIDFVNGFDLYVNPRVSRTDFFNHIIASAGIKYFDFDIKTVIPAFYYFTELPPQILGRLLYDSGAPSNIADGGTIHLSPAFSADTATKNLGSLTVHFDDITKTTGYARFSISYAARSTQWQYYIINRSAVQLNEPAISGKADIAFQGPRHAAIRNGQQAMLFTSGDKLIPFSKVPKYKFDLVNNMGQAANQRSVSPRVIFRGLPNPDPARMEIVESDENTIMVSPMYVYV